MYGCSPVDGLSVLGASRVNNIAFNFFLSVTVYNHTGKVRLKHVKHGIGALHISPV
jgi:hypothetical protein